ncbi:MAG: hypothetical protein JSV36_07340 [Anaerolineae bacterium]|nr:MAG: hypothetical protein JSV36_07340 [Anaerolineae bacterium]
MTGNTRQVSDRAVLSVALLLSALSAFLYLGWTSISGRLGFPLDDSWIHQTYARNLAQTGQLAYVPGQPSAGSTSPLWTVMLSVGYLLRLDYRFWTYLLGAVTLALVAWASYRLAGYLFPDQPWVAPLAGLFCALEWHLVWSAFSGMETILFIWLALLLMGLQLSMLSSQCAVSDWKFARAGIVAGLLVLARPEGALLGGLVGLAWLWRGWRVARWHGVRSVVGYGLAFVAVVSPWIVFNLHASGQLLPNTFYAKQAEYRVLLSLPIWTRLGRVLLPTVTGPQILLIPGFVYAALCPNTTKLPHSSYSVPLFWLALTALVYALRLPVNYQHGRYFIPIIPALVVYGAGGTARLLRLVSGRRLWRVIGHSLLLATILLLLVFWVRGAQVYTADTGFIEGEMVAVARWLKANTEPDALVAVHDVGAVGYFTQRQWLDLAGLITPEVVPFIADEVRLLAYMAEQGADYAIFFPDWSAAYRRMADDPRLRQVYSTGFTWTRSQGHQNMTVFRVKW